MGGSYSRSDTKFNVLTSIKIALKGLKVWKNLKSEFFFWELGSSMGSLASTIFVAIDVWADTHVITPMPAYIRYLDN